MDGPSVGPSTDPTFLQMLNKAKRAFLWKFVNELSLLSVKQLFLRYTSHKLIKLTIPYNAKFNTIKLKLKIAGLKRL